MKNYLTRRDKLYLTPSEQLIVNAYRANDVMLAKAQKLAKDTTTYKAFDDLRRKNKEDSKRKSKRDISAFLK